jgi:hypothetical protein
VPTTCPAGLTARESLIHERKRPLSTTAESAPLPKLVLWVTTSRRPDRSMDARFDRLNPRLHVGARSTDTIGRFPCSTPTRPSRASLLRDEAPHPRDRFCRPFTFSLVPAVCSIGPPQGSTTVVHEGAFEHESPAPAHLPRWPRRFDPGHPLHRITPGQRGDVGLKRVARPERGSRLDDVRTLRLAVVDAMQLPAHLGATRFVSSRVSETASTPRHTSRDRPDRWSERAGSHQPPTTERRIPS